jgi:antitoxin component HigA of HigAB toxin-antitoxin module
MADITAFLDKAHEQKEFAELAELPIDAPQGVSRSDAEAIQKAFGVKTIRQLAQHKFIRAAQAITLLAGAK